MFFSKPILDTNPLLSFASSRHTAIVSSPPSTILAKKLFEKRWLQKSFKYGWMLAVGKHWHIHYQPELIGGRNFRSWKKIPEDTLDVPCTMPFQ